VDSASGLPRATLLVVADSPVPGPPDTAWASTSPEEAAEHSAAALLDTLDLAGRVDGARTFVAFAGSLAEAARRWEVGAALGRLEKSRYREGDGRGRLVAALADAALRYPGDPVLAIGTATPHLHPAELTRALATLRTADAVLGLTPRGTRWAFGLRDPAVGARLPAGWDRLGGAELSAALEESGLRVTSLREAVAVETPDDLAFVSAVAPGLRSATSPP
jgi:uncharacterized protein